MCVLDLVHSSHDHQIRLISNSSSKSKRTRMKRPLFVAQWSLKSTLIVLTNRQDLHQSSATVGMFGRNFLTLCDF